MSRASDAVSDPPDTISVTISPTSITVTAMASTSDPNGSPTRWATTSAWWTAAGTAPARNTPTTASTSPPGLLPHVTAITATASTGTATSQGSRRTHVVASMADQSGRPPLAGW